MALCVKDIMELPSGQRMELVAGAGGLDRTVISAEIADYEFARDVAFVPGTEIDLDTDLVPDGFMITSFLFAKDDPGLILPAVEKMEQLGIAGLAYKKVIYDDLPEEVLVYAEKKNFPIFSFGKTVWFENIIFDIMYAVQFDDKVYLSEDKIGSMVTGHMTRSEMDIILKGISLKLRKFVSAAYFKGSDEEFGAGERPGAMDTGRVLRSFYLSKTLRDKALAVRYGSGLFLILTSPLGDLDAHRLILGQVTETLGIPMEIRPAISEVHPASELAAAFRESWYCHIAMEAEGQGSFDHYGASGIYRLILPSVERPEMAEFAEAVLGAFWGKEELMETALAYAECGGEIRRTADRLCCHDNTVRYRLGKIRELSGLAGCTDAELFLHLKTAVSIWKIRELI